MSIKDAECPGVIRMSLAWTPLRGPSKTPEESLGGTYEPSAWSQRIVSDPAFRRAEEAANAEALQKLLLNLTPAEFNQLKSQGIDPFSEYTALMARTRPQ